MSLQRQFVSAVLWMSVAFCSTAVHAQYGDFGHATPAELAKLYDPLCDLDVHLFEPINCDCPDDRPLNTGWYFTYDRTNTWVSRPREGQGQIGIPSLNLLGGYPNPIEAPFDGILSGALVSEEANVGTGDSTYGNKFDFGFVTDSGVGYSLVLRKINNPNVRAVLPNTSLDGDPLSDFLNNDIGETFIALNAFNIYSFELNKTWRLPATPSGAILEPLLGLRYVRVRDHFDRRDLYLETADIPTFGTAGATEQVGFNAIQVLTQETTTDNDLFGGQFGIRRTMRRGRWVNRLDVRGLLFHNYRDRRRSDTLETVVQDVLATYDANGVITGSVTANTGVGRPDEFVFADDSNNFVYGGELNFQTSFEITKGFAVRFGGEIIAFSDGIGRGITATDDSMILAGILAGFSYNR